MKETLVILGIGFVLIAAVWLWAQSELRAFEVRCFAAGGVRVESFGTALRSNKCLDAEGRILNVEGPGL